MTYTETLDWMFSKLPMYQRQGKSAYKKDLSNTLKLAKYLKHPEQNIKTIHVAGTNGKGSTSHMLASVFQESGYKTGLFTSPHLKDYRERIRVNGQVVSEHYVVDFINRNKSFLEQESLSFFEMTTLLGFSYFEAENVDVAIIEVGLGGRLDSTNIITPLVSVITNIGLDHTQFLGHDLATIAKEKAGIIKERVPVVIGETQYDTQAVFKTIAKERHAPIYFADQLIIDNAFKSDLIGTYQEKNIKTVRQAIGVINEETEFSISEEELKKGLLQVVANTNLKGRWQILQAHPKVICDTAHNKEGLSIVFNQLKNETFDELHIVFGVVNDKNLEPLFNILPKTAKYYLCKPNIPRGLDETILKEHFDANGYTSEVYDSVNQAFCEAKNKAKTSDLIYVGGSTFTVAEII